MTDNSRTPQCITDILPLEKAQLAGAVEYADCITTDG